MCYFVVCVGGGHDAFRDLTESVANATTALMVKTMKQPVTSNDVKLVFWCFRAEVVEGLSRRRLFVWDLLVWVGVGIYERRKPRAKRMVII